MKQSSNTNIEPLNHEVFSFPEYQEIEWFDNPKYDEDFSELTFMPEDLQYLSESMEDFIEMIDTDDSIQDFLKREEQELKALSFETIDNETMQDIKDVLKREDRELRGLTKGW